MQLIDDKLPPLECHEKEVEGQHLARAAAQNRMNWQLMYNMTILIVLVIK